MKTYIIYCCKGFDFVNDENKSFHCVRAMIGEVVKVGGVYKVKSIKLIKCASDFHPIELNKPVNIFFDENGKAVASQLVTA